MNISIVTQRLAIVLSLVLGTASVTAAPTIYQLYVDGLACPFCAYGLEKKLGTVKGVKSIETHIKNGAVMVTMQEGLTLDAATAKKAVQEAGFSLRKFEEVQSALQGPPGE